MGDSDDYETPISPKFRRISPKLRSDSEITEAAAPVAIADLRCFLSSIVARTHPGTALRDPNPDSTSARRGARLLPSIMGRLSLTQEQRDHRENPMIAAQAIIGMISVNAACSTQGHLIRAGRSRRPVQVSLLR